MTLITDLNKKYSKSQRNRALTLIFVFGLWSLGLTGCSPAQSSSEFVSSSTNETKPMMEMDILVQELNQAHPSNDEHQFSRLTNEIIQRLPETLGNNPSDTVKALIRVVRVGKALSDQKKAILALSSLPEELHSNAEIIIPELIQLLGNIAMRPNDPSTPYYDLKSVLQQALGMRGFGETSVPHLREIFQDARQLDADRVQAVLAATRMLSSEDEGGLDSKSNSARILLEILMEVMNIPQERGFPLRKEGRTHDVILKSLRYMGAEAQPALVQLRKEFQAVMKRVFSDQEMPGDRDHGTELLNTIDWIESEIKANPPEPLPGEPTSEDGK